MKIHLQKTLLLLLTLQFIAFGCLKAQTGTWTQVTNLAPDKNQGVMLLLTDGTIICHTQTGGGEGTGWDKLTPDASGSYINGTWTTIASNTSDRLFFSSQVLANGKVYVAGGEYGHGDSAGEIYDPVVNLWSPCGAVPDISPPDLIHQKKMGIDDGNSEILADGRVLEGPQVSFSQRGCCSLTNGYNILYYNPTTNLYSVGPNSPLNHDEAQWLKLPDNSILYVGLGTDSSCRYISATNTWVKDANLPVSLYDQYGEEAGSAFMLPNGKAIFFGATPHNAIYTPSGTTSPGSWVAAADFPTIGGTQVGMTDASSAMLVNGHILCAVSPIGTSPSDEFRTPTYFVEYNYLTNTFTQVTSIIPGFGADSIAGLGAYLTNMLPLPDGNVLFSFDQTSISQIYWIYTPGSAAIAAGKPTISGIIPGTCPSYKLTGKLFNGISEGAAYGDDWQMETNYPIVRLTNGSNVYYAKTTNWNRIGAVQTDSLADTVTFTPPATLPAGTYSLVVVANGFASNPVIFKTLSISIASKVDNVCNTGTGSITANAATGGVAPYTYSWVPSGGTNITASGLTANTYTVTVSDGSGCTATASATITQPAAALADGIPIHNSDASCHGGTGSATAATPTGGTSPYTYAWNGGATSTNATNAALTAGNYTVNVTDAHGCAVNSSSSVTITQPISALADGIPIHNSDASCNGGTGSATAATPTGGTSPYTYAWNGGATSTNATNAALTAGNYTVNVTDAHGCAVNSSSSVTITQPISALADGIPIHNSDASCNGGTGSATAAAPTGGTSPYTYAWNGGATSTNATNAALIAGSYTVNVTDAHGCAVNSSSSVTITQPISALADGIPIHNSDASCNGGTGSATAATPTGGTSPYTYAWNGGSTSTNATNAALTAGIYTVNVTDAHGCTVNSSSSVTITQPISALADGIPIHNSDASCHGGTGSATAATPTGGTSPYTYAWNGGATSTNATNAALTAGTYTVNVTDAHGCTVNSSSSVTITQPISALADGIPIHNSDASCHSGTGSATAATPTGGTSPYTYAWNGGATSTNATNAALTAGSYTVNVTDAHGCTVNSSGTVTITAPAILVDGTPTLNSNVLCFGGNGSATAATPSGGTAPYTYQWNGGTTSTNSTNAALTAGTYTVNITDAHGCSVNSSGTVTITAPAILVDGTPTLNSNVLCFGGNGSATAATPSGGTAPYTYQWNGGTTSTNSTNAALTAGTYTVNITDAHGCAVNSSSSVTITQPASGLGVSATANSNITCYGGSDGSVNANASGGTIPYTYLWSDAGSQTTATASNLSAGTYSVTIHDNGGCSVIANVAITQPIRFIYISAGTISEVSCNGGNNGHVNVSPVGGNLPYTYIWSNGISTVATSQAPNTMSAGTFTITVSDNCGVTHTATAVVTQPNDMRDSVKAISYVGCFGGGGGSITLGAKGGNYPYNYIWSNGSTLVTASGLSAGTYSVVVTDTKGCTNTVAGIAVTQPTALGSSISTNCVGSRQGTLTINGSGGTPAYKYTWSNGKTTTTMTVADGTYTVKVSDSHGCNSTNSVTLACPGVLNGEGGGDGSEPPACCATLDNITLYPNPTTGQFTITGLERGMTVEMYDYTGRKISPQFTTHNSQFTINLSSNSNGVYLIRILDKDGNLISQKKVVKTN